MDVPYASWLGLPDVSYPTDSRVLSKNPRHGKLYQYPVEDEDLRAKSEEFANKLKPQ